MVESENTVAMWLELTSAVFMVGKVASHIMKRLAEAAISRKTLDLA